jgi:hypothetical protein
MSQTSASAKMNVYLCYSPQDQAYVQRFRIHLKPMENEGVLCVWDETSILVLTRKSVEGKLERVT